MQSAAGLVFPTAVKLLMSPILASFGERQDFLAEAALIVLLMALNFSERSSIHRYKVVVKSMYEKQYHLCKPRSPRRDNCGLTVWSERLKLAPEPSSHQRYRRDVESRCTFRTHGTPEVFSQALNLRWVDMQACSSTLVAFRLVKVWTIVMPRRIDATEVHVAARIGLAHSGQAADFSKLDEFGRPEGLLSAGAFGFCFHLYRGI